MRINEILKQMCMVCLLQGDRYYINTKYYNKFFSDGTWGKNVARHKQSSLQILLF